MFVVSRTNTKHSVYCSQCYTLRTFISSIQSTPLTISWKTFWSLRTFSSLVRRAATSSNSSFHDFKMSSFLEGGSCKLDYNKTSRFKLLFTRLHSKMFSSTVFHKAYDLDPFFRTFSQLIKSHYGDFPSHSTTYFTNILCTSWYSSFSSS